MYSVVRIGDKDVALLATGATPYRYNNVFHADIFKEMTSIEDGAAAYMIMQLAYVMAKAADKADMNTLNMDDFYSWLDQFGPNDIAEAAPEIMDVYNGSMKGEISPK